MKVNSMKHTFHISGMSCKGCKSHVEHALSTLPHIQQVNIDLKEETAELTMDEHVSLEVLQHALKGSLYQIHPESHPRVPKKLVPLPSISKGVYYCPMHCEGEKTYTKPRDCPVCGMDLVPLQSNDVDEDNTYQKLLQKFKVAAFFTIPIFLIAMSEMLPKNILFDLMPVNYWNWVQLVLSVPVVFYATWMFFQRAYASIISGHYNMFTLIGIGAGVAWLFSLFGLLFPGVFPDQFRTESGSIHLYFESATVILTLVMLGQLLEARAHRKTNTAIKELLKLAPNRALKLMDDQEIEIGIDEIIVGDLLRVKPGDKIPLDGEIIEGHSLIDESMITGEPIPLEKQMGDRVSAGTINGKHSFVMIARKVGSETLLAQIIELVNNASRSKAPIQKLADKLSGYFVPAVVLISLITAIIWLVFGPEPQPVYALVNAIAVLIIACPCALGLATPMSVMVGVGKGAELGVLVKDAESLEKMNQVDTLIIDKTGTITEGKPSVERVIALDLKEDKLIQRVASVNQQSEHPLAEATVNMAKARGIELLSVEDFESETGKGVRAKIGGVTALIGNEKLMSDNQIGIDEMNPSANHEQSHGKTVSYVAIDGKLAGMVVIADQIKETSRQAIQELKEKGVEVIMMTGDHELTAHAVAKELSLDEVVADCLPADKMNKVDQLKKQGKIVAMAGDGINDAPALALADVGIAMGTGTDVAIESASIALVKGDLRGIVKARNLSEAVMKNVKQNLFFALVYNGLGVPIAAGLMFPFFGILLSPMIAALAMSFSSVSVISNALRLRSKSIG
ncbi:MAG: heavy metal translocating P-type ATPase [Reichenbachiella sp.]|uniref:heavy metal translocating P-type ATPase n=3 Tax=Reichenbachiella sp. TaxID=2184521 RepID=UPI00326622BA